MARSQTSPAAGEDAQALQAFGIDADETLHAVLKLSNKLMAPFSTYLERRYKISVNEFRALMLIGRDSSIASHEIADMTGVNIMSVSRAVAALQKHGRIVISRDPNNRRRKTLALTPEGRRLYEGMRPQSEAVAQYMISNLRPDEVMAFNRYLHTLIATLEATDEEGRSLFMERTRPREDEASDDS